MRALSVSDLKTLHALLIQSTGGMDGLRDPGLLESEVMAPYQTFGGRELYPTLPEKAARLCCFLIQDHPFLDGNKRIGVLAMLTLLELNHSPLAPSDDDLIRIGLDVASGTMSAEQVRDWIISSIR